MRRLRILAKRGRSPYRERPGRTGSQKRWLFSRHESSRDSDMVGIQLGGKLARAVSTFHTPDSVTWRKSTETVLICRILLKSRSYQLIYACTKLLIYRVIRLRGCRL